MSIGSFKPYVRPRLKRVEIPGARYPVAKLERWLERNAYGPLGDAEWLERIPHVQPPLGLAERVRSDPRAGIALAAEVVAAVRDISGVVGCHLSPLGSDTLPRRTLSLTACGRYQEVAADRGP